MKHKILYESELDSKYLETREEIDLSHMLPDDTRELMSVRIDVNGLDMWCAQHHTKGVYYTSNERDPKILNFKAKTKDGLPTIRPRGNISFANGDVARSGSGRKSGVLNKTTVLDAVTKLDAQPAEFLAAILVGDIPTLRKFRVKEANKIPLSFKYKAAEKLMDKLYGNAKSVDVDEHGKPIKIREVSNEEKQIQVYIPSTNAGVSIKLTDEEAEEVEDGFTFELSAKSFDEQFDKDIEDNSK